MRIRHILLLVSLFVFAAAKVPAQTGEIVVSLDEGFFEALLDAVFKDDRTVDFNPSVSEEPIEDGQTASQVGGPGASKCDETVKLRREIKGKRTSVQLRDGKIMVPVAFTGKYDPPILSCMDYSGIADTEIVLEFNKERQALVGTAKVRKVNLNGAMGLFGGFVAKMVQRSIDEKINPIEILGLDKVSFTVPVQNVVNVSMKAVDMKQEIEDGVLKVRVKYEFTRI